MKEGAKPECQAPILDNFMNMTLLPVKFGFAPQRWCNSITCMIEKDSGSPKIECLQVIHLYDADYNFVLKLIWGRQLMYHGEDHEVFGHQQFTWPGQQCIDAMHKKTLMYDLAQILIVSLANFDNDATGCYGSIIVTLGMIMAARLTMLNGPLDFTQAFSKR